MDITWKMCYFLLVIFSLISASAAEMSRATTREFRWCFPQSWVNTDQVTVSCDNTKIAQYCVPPDQRCGNKSSPGVSLEKGRDGVCLTITNCSYDSWSCEAQSYISDKEYKDTFTVNFCNQPTSTLPSPGNNEPYSGSNVAVCGPIIGWIILGLVIFGLIIGLFIYSYKKVERFKIAICNFWSHLKCMICFNKKQDMAERMEMGEKMRVNGTTEALGASEPTEEIGEREEMRANGATGALGVSEATGEIGEREEMRANGATGALGVSEATGEIGEREEMGETGEVGDTRAREETEKLLPHTQNNTVYQTKHSLM